MIKTNSQAILETGKQAENSYDIEICGCKSLKNCKVDFLEEYANQKQTACFKDCFKNKQKFFYKVVQYSSVKIRKYEVGIAHIESKKNKCFLVRDKSFYFSLDGENIIPRQNSNFVNFQCLPDEFLVISQYLPVSYIELLYEPHSIIISEDSFVPSSLDVKKNSVVGRKGGSIQSLPIEDIISSYIRYNDEEGCVEFNNKGTWIKLSEKINEDTK